MFESLSPLQREIVFNMSGKFVIRACPGSGKTYCVSARLARLTKAWRETHTGIAVLSFTNVAWQGIDRQFKEDFENHSGISFPHFLGTIDSFVNRFIFLPHGHLMLNCNGRPTLVGEPHGSWTGKGYSSALFDNISYSIDGSMFAIQPTRMKAQWQQNKFIVQAKKRLSKAGFATQQDANYFAMRVLETYPAIAKALALRFPFLIVDEAQDTSDIQMRIIDLLIDNGLNEVMLVGDPDQAIFEWNDAKPELINQKYRAWQGSIVLNENRRSSQHICNFTHGISSLQNPSTSVDAAVRDFNYQPQIIVYANNLPDIVNSFLDLCAKKGIQISEKTVSIIYRAKDMFSNITEIKEVPFAIDPWVEHDNYTKDFARGKFLYDNGEFKKGFKLIEKPVLKMLTKSEFCSQEMIDDSIRQIGFIEHRSLVFDFIKILPYTDVSLGDWTNAANEAFFQNKVGSELKITKKAKDIVFRELFLYEQVSTSRLNFRIGTVHSVKGETFDATLLILKERASNRGKYTSILANANPPSGHEELRIAYVGMTRPRKILMLAVPSDESKTAWEHKLNGIN
ncbi:MAG: ATP-dependent helicase [Ignavibacteria bacterium]|nr:ATP-dependent helicase [Ignavibacteria bacterium]